MCIELDIFVLEGINELFSFFIFIALNCIFLFFFLKDCNIFIIHYIQKQI